MERWTNKIAVVTGAGSGIGEAIARELCAKNVVVVGVDLLKDRLDKLSEVIAQEYSTATFVPIVCDLTKEAEIQAAFDQIIKSQGGVDILINCAGLITKYAILEEGSDASLNTIMQTNVMAVVSCIKKAYRSMADRDTDGYIINLCSVAGHCTPNTPIGSKPFAALYGPSKSAISHMTKVLVRELVYYQKPKIRISNVSPGVVQTDIFNAANVTASGFETLARLQPVDIANTVLFILSTPSHVQVRDLIVEAVGAPFY